MKKRIVPAILVLLAFLVAEIPFGLAEWMATGSAPDAEGSYNIVIQATYNGIRGILPLKLVVGESEVETGNLTIEPVYPIEEATPITLRYDIHLGGTYNFTLVSGNVTVYYVSGGAALKSEELQLEKVEGYWQVIADTPLSGDYEAEVAVTVESMGREYGGRFVTEFSSGTPSENLLLSHRISKRILTPSETFTVSMDASFDGAELPGLSIFKAYLYGGLKTLKWDSSKHTYSAIFDAPNDEGIYAINIYAEGQGSAAQERVYVSEVSRPKSGVCPLASGGICSDMKDVRKCVADWKSEFLAATEDQIAGCFEEATKGVKYTDISCSIDYKGDLDGDSYMTATDLDIMQNLLLPMSASQRKTYQKCADYDLDGDVDTDDLKCMTNVLSGKWYGDANGGICFDIADESPLKGDMDGDDFITNSDTIMMRDLLGLIKEGVGTPPWLLGFIDFTEDGKINQQDADCLEYFVGMDLDRSDTLLAYGKTIPSSCMGLYDLDDCQGIRGDLNGDLKIDAVDEILIMLAEKRQITGYDLDCADVNEELGVTIEDVDCVKAYITGDINQYYVCIGCDEDTPSSYRREYEICGDGYDNDCNGLVDRTSENPSLDWCSCIKDTPCWMNYDNDYGIIPGVEDGYVKVCRKVSWDTSTDNGTGSGLVSEYKWMLPIEFICSEDKSCESVSCDETTWKCAFDGFEWQWYERPKDLITESDDPTAAPKLCDDGYDNDCSCGDKKCKELESGNMFTSWQFWVGFIAGALIAWFCPVCATALFYLSIAMTIGSFFVKDPGIKAMMSGFSMGVSLGSMASQAFGPLAAQKTLEQGLQKAGQQAIEKAAKEAGKSVTEFAKTTSKETLQSIAKQGMTEVAKASGKTIAQGTIDSVSKTVAGTAVASVDLGAKIANAVTTFAKGLLTGTNTVAKLALGMASSKAMSNAMTAYAKSEAEWVSHDTKVCTDGS